MKTSSKLATLLIIFLFTLGTQESLLSQREPGQAGIGLQIGQPTGIALKVYNPKTSLDILAAWDLDEFFFLNVHALWNVGLNDAHTVHFYYGPGAFVGLDEDEAGGFADYGISGNFGFDIMLGSFEIFIQATPRFSLISTRDLDIGGGAGFRIYL